MGSSFTFPRNNSDRTSQSRGQLLAQAAASASYEARALMAERQGGAKTAKESRRQTKTQRSSTTPAPPPARPAVDVGAFEPVAKRTTTSKFVLGQIISLLSEGKLQPGDRLPTERELAALLGIGRPSVREALSALVLLGVVEQRQGRGTFLVDRIDRLPVEPYLYQLMLAEGRVFDDLLEVRELLEPAIALLAAKRATDADLAEIESALELSEHQVASGAAIDAEAVAGADFHAALARATGNQTLARLVESMRDLLSATGYVLNEQEEGASLDAHRALTEAIVRRNASLAESLMRTHLKDVSDRLNRARAEDPAASAARPRLRARETATGSTRSAPAT
jgi:GntR family transcriptional repressor for pyruvate dehydrogenase complex